MHGDRYAGHVSQHARTDWELAGPRTTRPVRGLICHLLERTRLADYRAVGISAEILELAKEDLQSELPDHAEIFEGRVKPPERGSERPRKGFAHARCTGRGGWRTSSPRSGRRTGRPVRAGGRPAPCASPGMPLRGGRQGGAVRQVVVGGAGQFEGSHVKARRRATSSNAAALDHVSFAGRGRHRRRWRRSGRRGPDRGHELLHPSRSPLALVLGSGWEGRGLQRWMWRRLRSATVRKHSAPMARSMRRSVTRFPPARIAPRTATPTASPIWRKVLRTPEAMPEY